LNYPRHLGRNRIPRSLPTAKPGGGGIRTHEIAARLWQNLPFRKQDARRPA